MSLQSLNKEVNKPLFQADWPQSLPSAPAKDKSFVHTAAHSLFSLIFFPYGIYRLAKAGCKKLAGNIVYSSPSAAHSNRMRRAKFRDSLVRHYGGENLSVRTPDGHKINGMLCRGTEKKAIIYCIGRGEYFESGRVFNRIHDIAEQVGDINLLLFNPRGVGENEGDPSAKGAALDLYSLFQYLVKVEGIDPNDIVIYGHSLGGAYGTLGAELAQKEYPKAKINLLSDRSFYDYGETIRQFVLKQLGALKPLKDHPEIRKRIEKIVSQIIVGLVEFSEWEIQAEKAFKSLKGRVCLVYSKVDQLVPRSTSAYKKIQENYSGEQPIRCIKLFEPDEAAPAQPSHARYFAPWEKFEIVNELKAMLQLQPEEPINLRRVKEIGPTKSSELPRLSKKGPDRDFDIALHAATRLYDYLDSAPEDVDVMTERLMTIFSSVQTDSLLFRHFLEQENALKKVEEPPSVSANPQGTKAFYLHVFAKVREALLLEQAEKNIWKNHR